MKQISLTVLFLLIALASPLTAGQKYETDTLKSTAGNVLITFLGHASLMVEFNGKVVYIDPVSRYADFSTMPKASMILVTHEHGDHFDSTALEACRTEKTIILCTKACLPRARAAIALENGQTRTFGDFTIEAVPAYNLVHMRSEGVPFHAKGTGNGYVIAVGGKRMYVAGDTENIPEMSNLGAIDVAFLPMNLPYTMTPEMVAEAAGRIHPKILYPYHFGKTDPALLVNLLKDKKGIEVRIRKME